MSRELRKRCKPNMIGVRAVTFDPGSARFDDCIRIGSVTASGKHVIHIPRDCLPWLKSKLENVP